MRGEPHGSCVLLTLGTTGSTLLALSDHGSLVRAKDGAGFKIQYQRCRPQVNSSVNNMTCRPKFLTWPMYSVVSLYEHVRSMELGYGYFH